MAFWSATSFPRMPLCPGTQQTIIFSFNLYADINALIRCLTKMFLVCVRECSVVTTLSESVKMMDCCVLVCVMCCTAIKMPCASAVKMLLFLFNVFVLAKCGPCAAHDTAEGDLEASV